MSMKWSIIKTGLISSAALLVWTTSVGQQEKVPVAQTRQERAREHYVSGWNKLIPRYSKIHFAGGMGVISVGPGWD